MISLSLLIRFAVLEVRDHFLSPVMDDYPVEVPLVKLEDLWPFGGGGGGEVTKP